MAGTGDADETKAAADSDKKSPAAVDKSDSGGMEAGKSDASDPEAAPPGIDGADVGETDESKVDSGDLEAGGPDAGRTDASKVGPGRREAGGPGSSKSEAGSEGAGDDTESTAFAPLSQWASRAGKRSDVESATPPEFQSPTDPWPKPIQGLIPPLGQPYTDHDLLRHEMPEEPPSDGVQVPPKRRSGLVAAVSIVAVALLLGTAGVITAVNLGTGGNDDKKREVPAAAASFPVTTATTASTATATGSALAPSTGASSAPEPSVGAASDPPDPAGPVAQGIPPVQIFDTAQICDGVAYWPMLPKRSATKAPHPIMVYDQNLASLGDKRGPRSMFNGWFMRSKALEGAWAPTDDLTATGSTVQVVACLDRTSTGAKVRSCKVNNPDPHTLALYRASWRLHVYETATGKKLLDTTMAAKDTSCPDPSQAGFDNSPDKKLYMDIDDNTLLSALKKFVEH